MSSTRIVTTKGMTKSTSDQLIHQWWYSTFQSKVYTSSWRTVFRNMTCRGDTFSTLSCDGSTIQMIRRTVIYFSCQRWKIWCTWGKKKKKKKTIVDIMCIQTWIENHIHNRRLLFKGRVAYDEKQILFIFIVWSERLTCRSVSVSHFDWMCRDDRRTRSGDNLLPNSV